MEDATQIEQLFSHSVPQLYAAGITVVLMGIIMFIYNWQLSLAMLWVVPVAILVFTLSKKFQDKINTTVYLKKREITDDIQEELDSVHEIKSYNREGAFAKSLDSKLNHYERFLIKTELLVGACVNFSQAILKLGLPSVILAGAYMLSTGSISVFTYIVFLVITARIYNPITEAIGNMAALLYLKVRINRMKEMDGMPRQEGKNEAGPCKL